MVIGLAKKVGETKPPSVKNAQMAKNSTKNPRPSTRRVPGLTGSSGARPRRRGAAGSDVRACEAVALVAVFMGLPLVTKGLFDEAVVVHHAVVIRQFADHASLQQDGCGVFHELLQFAGKEFLVGRPVLPAQEGG